MATTVKKVSYETAVQAIGLMLGSKKFERLDLGHSFVYRGTHPKMGEIVVLSSAEGASAIVIV